jgi:hypothetical protein
MATVPSDEMPFAELSRLPPGQIPQTLAAGLSQRFLMWNKDGSDGREDESGRDGDCSRVEAA